MSPVAMTLLILVIAVVAFMSNRVPLGVVAIGVSVSLWLTGILDLNDALAGFGDPTVIFIATLCLRDEYRAGNLEAPAAPDEQAASASLLPAAFQNTPGTLFVVGLVVLAALGINNLTDGVLNTFVVALIFGIALRAFKVFKPSVLAGIDSFGLMMLAIMILVFGPLATVEPADVKALAFPLFLAFVFGVAGIVGFSALVGKLVGYSIPMSVAIGLTSLYGFPGTMILSQEAAKGAGETPEEVAAIENSILPKMIVAGFSTVTITSVIVTSIIAGRIGN